MSKNELISKFIIKSFSWNGLFCTLDVNRVRLRDSDNFGPLAHTFENKLFSWY